MSISQIGKEQLLKDTSAAGLTSSDIPHIDTAGDIGGGTSTIQAAFSSYGAIIAGLGGSSPPTFNLTENVSANDLICKLPNSNDIAKADKRYSDHVIVLGFATGSGIIGGTVSTRNSGFLTGFTGLTAGSPVFLGDAGAYTQDDTTILDNEYRVYIGTAVNTTTIYITIYEATLNAPQDVLSVNAFKGKKFGLDIYSTATDVYHLRVGAAHVNDGYTDYWVERTNEFNLSTDPLYPAGASSGWFYVLLDKFGNISLLAGTGTSAERPTDSYYQWGELGGTGFNHARQGYYYNDKRIIGALLKVSSGVWYLIDNKDYSNETGENSLGNWKRTENDLVQYGWDFIQGDGTTSLTKTITLPQAFATRDFYPTNNELGNKSGSDPTNVYDISTSNYSTGGIKLTPASMSTVDVSWRFGATIASTYRYIFSFSCIGPWR